MSSSAGVASAGAGEISGRCSWDTCWAKPFSQPMCRAIFRINVAAAAGVAAARPMRGQMASSASSATASFREMFIPLAPQAAYQRSTSASGDSCMPLTQVMRRGVPVMGAAICASARALARAAGRADCRSSSTR